MNFNEWWSQVGSGITKLETEDNEEHAHRVAKAAWVSAIGEAMSEWDDDTPYPDDEREPIGVCEDCNEPAYVKLTGVYLCYPCAYSRAN